MLEDRLLELLSASLDGALSPQETEELEAALAGNSDAQQLLAAMLADKEALRALPALQTPEELKRRTLTKAKAAGRSTGLPQGRLLMAASLILAVGLAAYALRPFEGIRNRLHLRPGQLAGRAASIAEEIALVAEGGKPHLFSAQAVSGKHTGGAAHLRLHCDAGTRAGRLVARLAFDFEGDGKVDSYSQARELKIDDTEGYQVVACSWDDLTGMRDLDGGQVHLELSNGDKAGPPLKVRFEPEQAHLDLPFQDLELANEA
jgi:hypothetical protein